jgi:hypothetical protein
MSTREPRTMTSELAKKAERQHRRRVLAALLYPGESDRPHTDVAAEAWLAELEATILADAAIRCTEHRAATPDTGALRAALSAANDILDANPTEDSCRHGNDVFECDEPEGCADRSRRELIRDAAATPSPDTGAGLRVAFAYLRKHLVGTPPNVDGEDAWIAGRIDEAEQIALRALPEQPPSLDAGPEIHRGGLAWD